MTADTTQARCHEITDDLPLLVEAFRLGEVQAPRYLADGLMNRNWRIDAERGTFALKLIMDVALPTARRNLRILAALAADDGGVPVCSPVESISGDVAVEIDGRGYCLLPWAQGAHLRGTELSLNQAADLGALLGRIHRRLNRLGPETGVLEMPAAVRATVTEPVAAMTKADRYLNIITALDAPQPFDLAAAELLEQRKILIEKYGSRRPAGEVPKGPFGWTHGDVQHRNVLWMDGQVTAVLDWDRIRVWPFGEEVARTAAVQFGTECGQLDLERVAAFVSGYCTVIELTQQDLADAVERLWWTRMSEFWTLDFHYDRGDHGPDELFFSGEQLLSWWSSQRAEVQAAFAAA
ncbi:phosphotransferase [Streptosporangium canum]|uniref:phosphotransferase n=1 Tax=Streptosporangium canum TaxID=324952 RepID=UPI0036C3FA91